MDRKYKYKNIGIIGQGYVGSAIKHVINESFNVSTYDKFIKEKSTHHVLKELVYDTDIIFLCLPTPMNEDGTCHTDIVEETLTQINSCVNKESQKKIVVIKSTVPPGTSQKLQTINNNIDIIYNPEFLREASFIEDFRNQKFIILGGSEEVCANLSAFYKSLFNKIKIIVTNYSTAEMTKNLINTFLATKVSFANEMKLLCDQIGIEFSDVIDIAKNDDRIGSSHWDVPGHDGKLGFGGSCFPKDIQSMVRFADSLNIDANVLKAAIKTNHKVRPEKDWQNLTNRAVLAKKNSNDL